LLGGPVPTSPHYGEWARGERPQPTVYGERRPSGAEQSPGQYEPGQPQRAAGLTTSTGPLPLPWASGSLTGHILAQGRPDQQDQSAKGSSLLVFLLGGVGLLVLVGLAVTVLFLSGMI